MIRSTILALFLTAGLVTTARADMQMAPNSDDTPAVRADKAGMAKMDEGMGKYTGNPDIDFATNMIPHHQGAIDMAEVELAYGTDPEMRKLATDIIAAQKTEIAQMQDWLSKHPQ
jgi:uncharacterized protein (DUF305 family)